MVMMANVIMAYGATGSQTSAYRLLGKRDGRAEKRLSFSFRSDQIFRHEALKQAANLCRLCVCVNNNPPLGLVQLIPFTRDHSSPNQTKP